VVGHVVSFQGLAENTEAPSRGASENPLEGTA
jgi:hypothetical protein